MGKRESLQDGRLNEGRLAGVVGGVAGGAADGGVAGEKGLGRLLCPKCGRPVRYSPWLRYYCEACDESWCYETDLVRRL